MKHQVPELDEMRDDPTIQKYIMCLTESMRELSRTVCEVILYKVILNNFEHRKFKQVLYHPL